MANYSEKPEKQSLLLRVFLTAMMVILSLTDAQSLHCSVDSGGVCPDEVCPGDVVTYTCDVATVMGSTVWRLPAGTCPENDDAIGLPHTTGCSTATGMCGPFEAANKPSVGGECSVSTLTVTASHNINNSHIECTNEPPDPLGNVVIVGDATLLVEGPPSAPILSVSTCTGDSITLMWKDTSAPVTDYILSATPPVKNCDPNCTVSTRQFTFTGLLLDQSYIFSVSGVNCGNQIGEAACHSIVYSGPAGMNLTINYEYVYDELGGDLRQIRASWIPVNNYMITYESDSDSVVANRQCSNEEPCKDTFDDISEGVDYIVSVTGFEAANPVKVMSKNIFLSVMVDASKLPWRISCKFLSGYSTEENVHCEMKFTDGGVFNGTGVSMMTGGDGDTVEILVDKLSSGEGPPTKTNYSYEVTTNSTTVRAVVSGTFISGDYLIDCTLQALGASPSFIPSDCRAIEMAGEIPNGTLCYTGLTPGSTATYSCGKGYELSGGNEQLVCQGNGTWHGMIPTCVESDDGLSSGGIAGIVIIMVLLLVAVIVVVTIIGAAVHKGWCCKTPYNTRMKEEGLVGAPDVTRKQFQF